MGRSKGNSGSWLVTYSDMVTLLMVFFIVLYTMTPGIDQSQFDNFISYFQNSVGVMQKTAAVQQSNQDSREDYREEIVEQWSVVEDFVERMNLQNQVEIEQ